MKKIILSGLFAAASLFSVAQTRVLYFADYSVGTDQMAQALINQGCIVTTVSLNSDFQTEIAIPANFDMAIYFSQNYGSDNTSVTALANFVNMGKKGMYADYATDPTNGALVGVSFTGGYNETNVTVSDATLAAGLTTNPFTITNTGWGIFSYGLVPLSGSTTAATFGSGDAAIVRSMSGNMLVFGYLSDVSSTPELYEIAISSLVTPPPTIATSAITGTYCAGASVSVPYTITGTFNGSNVFTAELSDATGSFASPTAIGTLSSTAAGTVTATIPSAAAYGTAYRIRVTGSNPVTTGTDNGTNLTISNPVASASTTAILCNGGSSTVTVNATGGVAAYMGTGTFTTAAGTYSYTVTDAAGCSSTATGTLTEPAAITGSQSVSLCPGTSVTVGTSTYSTAGTYTDVLTAANSCDSTVTTTVSMTAVDVSTNSTGATIIATSSTAAYQWLDCNSGYSIIAGENNQSYTATSNGSYAVEITENGCVDTSACVMISSVGIASSEMNSVSIYPNPAIDQMTIAVAGASSSLEISIVDIQGKAVLSISENNLSGDFKKQISTEGIAKGMYYINVKSADQLKVYKLAIQ
jgi:hypothetical protein